MMEKSEIWELKKKRTATKDAMCIHTAASA